MTKKCPVICNCKTACVSVHLNVVHSLVSKWSATVGFLTIVLILHLVHKKKILSNMYSNKRVQVLWISVNRNASVDCRDCRSC